MFTRGKMLYFDNPKKVYWTDSGVSCWAVTFEDRCKLLLDYARAYNLKTFIETGTWHGDTVQCFYPHFDQVYFIELSPKLVEEARKKFSDVSNVHLYLGDSGQVLKELLSQLPKTPTLFWLDAHSSGGDTVWTPDVPLGKDLSTIFESGFDGVVFVDDLQDCWSHNWAEIAHRMVAKYGWHQETQHGIMKITREEGL